MAQKQKKQFGVWMDTRHATIVGRNENGELEVMAEIKGEGASSNSSENAANNHAVTLQNKFFKEITSHMQNAEEVHVTGTGKAQEQFINYLGETPQFKNTKTDESTANQMSSEKLVEFMGERLR